jgi:hypothetical protein
LECGHWEALFSRASAGTAAKDANRLAATIRRIKLESRNASG